MNKVKVKVKCMFSEKGYLDVAIYEDDAEFFTSNGLELSVQPYYEGQMIQSTIGFDEYGEQGTRNYFITSDITPEVVACAFRDLRERVELARAGKLTD